MKLRYPEDGYTRPAIIFFRAIGRLALRPRLSPPFRLLHHLPASSLFLSFHLSSLPLPSPKGKSMSMLCHFFHPFVPRSLSLSLARARIVDIPAYFFLPLALSQGLWRKADERCGGANPGGRNAFFQLEEPNRWNLVRTDALGNRFFSRADGGKRARGIRKGSIGFFFF